MHFRFLVWGDRACFARPEFVRDRISYDVITPFAARAIIDAIYRPPSIRWNVDCIHVLKPIRTDQIDLQSEVRVDLIDVAYVIEAYFEFTDRASAQDHVAQHASLIRRNVRRGRPHRSPFLGITDYAASFRLLEDDEPTPPSLLADVVADLGWMVHDLDDDCPRALRFFRPTMTHGIIMTKGGDTVLPR